MSIFSLPFWGFAWCWSTSMFFYYSIKIPTILNDIWQESWVKDRGCWDLATLNVFQLVTIKIPPRVPRSQSESPLFVKFWPGTNQDKTEAEKSWDFLSTDDLVKIWYKRFLGWQRMSKRLEEVKGSDHKNSHTILCTWGVWIATNFLCTLWKTVAATICFVYCPVSQLGADSHGMDGWDNIHRMDGWMWIIFNGWMEWINMIEPKFVWDGQYWKDGWMNMIKVDMQ